eukprot:GHVS01097703.1.p2 GENE.GHVS01097703.1~~GHVS01097703.1.p2  ORF type:complete len:138 (+),score=0.33 GHVS01097703.1:63-476(+)
MPMTVLGKGLEVTTLLICGPIVSVAETILRSPFDDVTFCTATVTLLNSVPATRGTRSEREHRKERCLFGNRYQPGDVGTNLMSPLGSEQNCDMGHTLRLLLGGRLQTSQNQRVPPHQHHFARGSTLLQIHAATVLPM